MGEWKRWGWGEERARGGEDRGSRAGQGGRAREEERCEERPDLGKAGKVKGECV